MASSRRKEKQYHTLIDGNIAINGVHEMLKKIVEQVRILLACVLLCFEFARPVLMYQLLNYQKRNGWNDPKTVEEWRKALLTDSSRSDAFHCTVDGKLWGARNELKRNNPFCKYQAGRLLIALRALTEPLEQIPLEQVPPFYQLAFNAAKLDRQDGVRRLDRHMTLANKPKEHQQASLHAMYPEYFEPAAAYVDFVPVEPRVLSHTWLSSTQLKEIGTCAQLT